MDNTGPKIRVDGRVQSTLCGVKRVAVHKGFIRPDRAPAIGWQEGGDPSSSDSTVLRRDSAGFAKCQVGGVC